MVAAQQRRWKWKAASSPRIESLLPDHLLEKVLERAVWSEKQQALAAGSGSSSSGGGGSSSGGSTTTSSALPLVCRRWHRVCNTSHLLHGTLSLSLHQIEGQLGSQDELAGLLCLLAQRGQAARRLWLHTDGTLLRMDAVLRLLTPQLQTAYLGQGAPADSLAHLSRFSSLRSLDLPAGAYAGTSVISAAAASAQGGHSAPAPWAALAGFRQLEELTLREGVPAELLSTLACLPRLRLLSVTLVEALAPACHRQLARLRHLEELHMYLQPTQPTHFDFQPGALCELSRLRSLLFIAPSSLSQTLTVGPGLHRLPALQELQVECCVQSLPPDLWACRHLTRLDLDLKGSPLPPPRPTPGATACLPPFRELRLARCRLPAGALPPALCALSRLRLLEVLNCGLAAGCASASLPPQFSRLRNLEHLSLEANSLCALPPAVAALPALRYLDLSSNQLAWLPPGPYMRTLDTLILSANRLTMVPPVLAGAASLEVLDMSGNAGLEVTGHDVDATLSRMPRLALLLLGKHIEWCEEAGAPLAGGGGGDGGLEWHTASVAALVALGQALPQLQIDFEHSAKEYEGVGV